MTLTKEQRESIQILKNIRHNLHNRRRECMVEDCKEKAINSHLLQRHGILDNIIEDGHMIELRPNDMFKWNPKESPIEFKLIGLNNAISHPLFCNCHDTEIFADIEKNNPDLYAYRNRLLFTYRAICADEYKKRFEVEFIDRIIASSSLRINYHDMKYAKLGYMAGIKDLSQMRSLVLDELNFPSDRFEFVHLEYPYFLIYASSPYSFETDRDKYNSSDLWDGGVVHIIPLKEKLHIIGGYLKGALNRDMNEYISKWKNADKKTLGLLLTDLFCQRIEGFGMSISLYRSISKNNIRKYFEFQKTTYQTYDMNGYADFNMFEGDIWNTYNISE